MQERLHPAVVVEIDVAPPRLADRGGKLQDAMERAEAMDTDLDALALLGVPLWALSAWDRASITARLASFPKPCQPVATRRRAIIPRRYV